MKASQTATRELLRPPAELRAHQQAIRDRPLVLDRYRLERRLGSGAFATVWLAYDERLERAVAVKVLVRDRVLGGRFEREARAAARLSHPGVVTLYEAAVDDDGAYLVSELVRGETLERLLDAGRLSDRDILEIGVALCGALAHAHDHGVVHRDVKPSNVLVPEQPPTRGQIAKLTDFGVARVIGGDSLTRTGDVIGTAAYMAPEQADGLPAGAAADLYSLALVLYEGLTGVNPLAAGAQRARRLGMHLPPLRRYRRELPRELGRGIDLALRPRARERGTVQELCYALSSAIDQVEDAPGVVGREDRPELAEVPWSGGGPAVFSGDHDPLAPPPQATPPVPRRAPRLRSRVLAGAGAALTAGWLDAVALSHPLLGPAAAALAAGITVAVLPSLGWLALTAALSGALLLQGSYGAALVLAVAALAPVALLPRAGRRWSNAVGAPALGAIALAGAWPAVAARARSSWQRAVLGALGWLWLMTVGALRGRGLYARLPHGLPSPGAWTLSAYEATHHVLGVLLSPVSLAPAGVWALAAMALPALGHPHGPWARLVLTGLWSAGTLLGVLTAIAVAGGGSVSPASALGGALAAVVVAMVAVPDSRSMKLR